MLTQQNRRLAGLAFVSFSIGLASIVAACSSVESGAKGIISCAPATASSIPSDPEWAPFSAFVDECLVRSPSGSTALAIVSVSALRFYHGKSPGTETVSFPKPIILSTAGQVIGRLPHSYPDDPPVSIRLSFDEWKDEFPRRIEIMVEDPTVSGNHMLPMIWDRMENRFKTSQGSAESSGAGPSMSAEKL
jgi:hypothetical protein